MSARIRKHIRGNVVGYIALFLVLTGGTAQALDGQNTVFSDDIVNGEVDTPDLALESVNTNRLAPDSVRTGRVLDDSLTGTDIDESSLGMVPAASNAANAVQANNASTLDGIDSSGFAGNRVYHLQKTTDGSANAGGTCPSGDLCYAGGFYCDPGDTMLGGGFSAIDNGTRLVTSEPFTPNDQDTWRVQFVNNSTEDTIVVDTICADTPPLHPGG
jgi:hypothetical protein